MRSVSLVIAATLSAGVVAAPCVSADEPALHPCAAATQRCDGELQLPLNWADPDSERITVSFAYVPRRDQSRPADGTILANFGGPSRMIPLVPLIEDTLGPVLDRQNLIVVDPRGFGASTPLECPGIDERVPATVVACVEHLGPERVPFFTPDQAVMDLDAVRAALGVPAVTFYGNSYGTVFGQAYVTRFPQRVRAVFLDSPVVLRDDGYMDVSLTTSNTIRSAFRVRDDVCRASRVCSRATHDPAGQWAELVRFLRAHPDPALPLGELATLPTTTGVFTRDAAAAANAYLDGDPAPLRRLKAELNALFAGGGPDQRTDPRLGAILSYTCTDSAFPFDRAASPQVRRAQLDDFYDRTGAFAPFTRAEAQDFFGPFGDFIDRCVNWPTPRESPPSLPGAAFPDVPAVVVGGQLDTTTDAGNVARTAARFPHGVGFVIPFGDHASSTASFGLGPYSECVRDTVLRPFLTDPTVDVPAPDCTAENYRALGTFPVRSTDLRGNKLLSGTFATVADALARRNPNEEITRFLTDEPGLRGGRIQFGEGTSTLRLEQVRFVTDLSVTGDITVQGGERATATVTTSGHAGTRRITMSWQAFRAEDRTRVTGTVDGRPFTTRFAVH